MMTQLAKEDRAEDAPGPSKKRKTTSELAREAYTSYLDGIERAKALENKMMKCMDKFLDMWNKIMLFKKYLFSI